MSIAVEDTTLDHRPKARIGVLRDGRARSRAGAAAAVRAETPWRRLALADLVVLAAVWCATTAAFALDPVTGAATAAAGFGLLAWQHLYDDAVADSRTAELRALGIMVLRLAVAAALVAWLAGDAAPASGAVAAGSAASLPALVATRVVYRAWLRNARAAGRFRRPIALVGIDEQTRATRHRLEDRPELGFAVVAAFGSPLDAHLHGFDDIWAGDVSDAPRSLARCGAGTALVSTTAVDPDEIDGLVDDLLQVAPDGVQLGPGAPFVAPERLQPEALDYAPVLRVDGRGPRRGELGLKRALDLAVGSLALALSLPVLALAAVTVKLGDRGPVLFRQVRVGRDGAPFTVYKLRTMTVDAEARLADLGDHNERAGPLFKMEQDPRVTRVGSLMRHLSIDELPQLWNVLRGEMSLVGPRPALPVEVERFDDRLRRRSRMRPGITGLWQIEARDHPAFDIYRRLDLHYVENWSLLLDLSILIGTVECELARVAQLLHHRVRPAAVKPVEPVRLEDVSSGHARRRTNGIDLAPVRMPATGTGRGTRRLRIAMLGTRGVPARYGGFETAVEEIGRRLVQRGHDVTVYCRRASDGARPQAEHHGMRLVTLPALRVRSAETLSHSALSSLHVTLSRRHDAVFVFNSANAVLLPLLRARRLPVAVHVDGLEWRRAKWTGAGAHYYRRAETLAVRWADALIADAPGIADYYGEEFGAGTELLGYGAPVLDDELPDHGLDELGLVRQKFHLVVARFEPENNVDLIVRGYRESTATCPLVVVGGAPYSDEYRATIRALAESDDRIRLVGSLWDQDQLNQLYRHALLYLHGHSVGGTNPSLLRAMGAGAAVGAYDVRFNRDVIGEDGWYFSEEADVARLVEAAESDPDRCWTYGGGLQAHVAAHHRWDAVADGYEALARRLADGFSRAGEATGGRRS